ncbi:MAG: phosphoribosylglycinamide formyltransferase [Planctomycetes bacterium]|nr:phosphoribosylglycinamide formyltransferase [Planctomycetota bacterium]
MTRRIAVLVSGGGRSLENLAERISAHELDCEIGLVLSNTADGKALERAERLGLPRAVVSHREFPAAPEFSRRVFAEIEASRAELVVLAGFLRLLVIPPRWLGRVLNIHPALLPAYGGKGFYGHRVHEAVLAAREPVTGCTVHYVTNEYDAGPILLQRRVDVRADDDADTLAARVFEAEKLALPEAIALHLSGAVRLEGARVVRTP